ncbi:hypothetical protein ACQP3D_27745, partial [Escherichia coli]
LLFLLRGRRCLFFFRGFLMAFFFFPPYMVVVYWLSPVSRSRSLARFSRLARSKLALKKGGLSGFLWIDVVLSSSLRAGA